MKNTQKIASGLALSGLIGASLIPTSAFAAGVDLSTITGAVDFSTVATAILAVGALLVVVSLTIYGVRKLLKFLPKG